MAYRPTAKTEAKKAQMRGRLLAAARRLFATQGYESTTLQQIVKDAATSIGNCYFYFPNKEAILLAIAEDLRNEIAGKIDAAIEGMPLGPELLAVAAYVAVMGVLDNAGVAQFALSGSAHPSLRPLTIELFTTRVQRAFESMPQLFADWPEATPQMAACAWHGSANFLLEAVMSGRIVEDHDRVARFLVAWNMQALDLSAGVVSRAISAVDRYIAGRVSA